MDDSSKRRLLVMNGQKIVQTEHDKQWKTQKVEKAGALKPGIYPIYLARPAEKNVKHDGVVLHADAEFVFQQVGKNFVCHARADFAKLPEIGAKVQIGYEDGQAVTTASSLRQGRGLSR